MASWIIPAIFIAGVLGVILLGTLIIIAKFYRKVDQGQALIINKMKSEPEVTFTGGTVVPIIHRAETMDISVKTIDIARQGKDGLICMDNIRADIKVAFFVRVNKTKEDVLKVAQAIGCVRASDQKTLEELFVAKFSEALKTVGKRMEFEQLYTQRDDFKDQIIEVIGRDLNGYVLDDAAIDYLEQTPLNSLDEKNILDAHGIRKITEITTKQNMLTNELRQVERKEITRQNLEADEAILELERRRADAEAKQQREIATVLAREQAETKKIQSEENQRSELARIKAEEDVQVTEVGKQRQVEIAEQDKARVVGIKAEQVERDRALEQITRERDVALQEIAKEKALEVEKKAIAEVVRTRVAVDKGVAEEEERIKDLRVNAEAERQKDVKVTTAEGEAEEALIKDIKAAEAAEKAAEFEARQRLVLANAEMEAADLKAKAKIRLAEGIQAEEAASGLAKVRVREADAVAIEKQGFAEARVTREQMQAQATGKEQIGLAQVKIKEANANAIELQGKAEATATKDRLGAEAAGLTEKANAMKGLEGRGWTHEEFRLKLDLAQKIQLEAIKAQQVIAEKQAHIMAEAFQNADMKIIGGDGQFFERFISAIGVGHAMDGLVDESSSVRALLGDYLNGDGDLNDTIATAIDKLPTAGAALRDLSIANVMSMLASDAEGTVKDKLLSLAEAAKDLPPAE